MESQEPWKSEMILNQMLMAMECSDKKEKKKRQRKKQLEIQKTS